MWRTKRGSIRDGSALLFICDCFWWPFYSFSFFALSNSPSFFFFPLPDPFFFSFFSHFFLPLLPAPSAWTWLTVCIWQADARRTNMSFKKKIYLQPFYLLPGRYAWIQHFFFRPLKRRRGLYPDSCASISMQGADVSKDYSTLDMTWSLPEEIPRQGFYKCQNEQW